MSSAMIIMSTTVAHNRYYQYATHFCSKDELKDSIFVQTHISFRENITDENGKPYEDYSSEEYQEKYNQIYQKLLNEPVQQKSREFSAVKGVYSYADEWSSPIYNSISTTIKLASEETYKLFDYSLSSGVWFQDCEQTSEYPNAVLCGDMYKDIQVGENIEIIVDTQTLKLHVIGKVKAPYYVLYFNQAANDAECINFNTSSSMENCIFLLDNDFTRNTIEQYNMHWDNMNTFFVSFKDDATQEEKDEYLNYLSQYGSNDWPAYLDTNTIVNNTVQDTQDKLLSSLPLSLFYIGIATFTLICISVITIKKKLAEHYTYYLCGCSRAKSFVLLVAGLFSVGIVSAIITFLYLLFMNYLLISGQNPYSEMLIDEYSYLYVFLYMIFTLLITLTVAFFSFRKHTPIELYKNKEDKP